MPDETPNTGFQTPDQPVEPGSIDPFGGVTPPSSWAGGTTPCYILMMKFTAEGARYVDDVPTRYAELSRKTMELGGTVEAYFVTMGEHDLVAGVTLPDDESAMCLAMRLTEQGYVTTTTMKAFSLPIYRNCALKR